MRSPTVALVHNHYQLPGGEDQVVAAERQLLEGHAHHVVQYAADNQGIEGMSRVRLAGETLWSRSSHRGLRELFHREAPDVVHFHNTFPLISPAGYYAARESGAAVVQTLHNFRLLCPNGLFFREGRVCERCLDRAVPWPGVLHGCYRGSRAASTVTAAMLAAHRAAGTWTGQVDVYVALSEFARQKFIQGGLPPEKVVVKPNFVPDPGVGRHQGGAALFVGRLSPEKGIGTLMDAWARIGERCRLSVVGSGPLDGVASRSRAGVEWLGQQPRERVRALMQDAAFLVVPSECYENFPMTVAEAFATGLPVIASGHGSLAEIVEDGRTGLHFRVGDAAHLAERVEWAVAHPAEMAEMGRAARREFEEKYSADRSYARLMEVYTLAAERAAAPV